MMNLILSILNWLTNLFRVYQIGKCASNKIAGNDKKRIAQGVKDFFDRHYELRYNTIKQQEEFRPIFPQQADYKNSQPGNFQKQPQNFQKQADNSEKQPQNFPAEAPVDGWRQLTDRELRRIAFEQMLEVGVAWSIDVELYVRSALTPDYNPIADYLSRCLPWDGQTDYIRQFARRVPTAYDVWPDMFHRWFLAMVAQWQQRSRDYGNSLVPMLIGGQGTHKSTFCKLILPPSLREYYIDDIKLDAAEQVERMLSRMLLVNIDEYNAKTEREQAKIKRVLTERDVQTRKMRSDQYVMLPRLASFIATTNDGQPLTDPTGSRRYLCCELTGVIDTDTPVLHERLYAQAVGELDHGAVWHLSKAEEAAVEEHNRTYQEFSAPEQLLLTYFMPAERNKVYFTRAVDIQQELARHVRATDVPNIKQLTIALKAQHFHHGRMDGQRGWYARRRTE